MEEWFPLVLDPATRETHGKQWASHVIRHYGTAFFQPGVYLAKQLAARGIAYINDGDDCL